MMRELPIRVFVSSRVFENRPIGAVEAVQYSVVAAIKALGIKVITVPLITADRSGLHLAKKIIRDIVVLWKGNRNVNILLLYPSIPLIPTTGNTKFVIAVMAYLGFFAISRLLGNKIITFIIDLPVQQEHSLSSGALKTSRILYQQFEKLLFKHSSFIVSPSQWFENQIRGITQGRNNRFLRYSRTPYYVDQNLDSIEIANLNLNNVISKHFPIAFYSGDLRREESWIRRAIDIVENVDVEGCSPAILICGIGGDWINAMECKRTFYLGYLDKKAHDSVARLASFGLMLYRNLDYYKDTPTTKYSAYIANGLPVLSIFSKTVASNINEDGTGKVVCEREFELELKKWISETDLFTKYSEAVLEKSRWFFSHGPILEWLDNLDRNM